MPLARITGSARCRRDGRRRDGGGFGLGLGAHARAMRPRDHRPLTLACKPEADAAHSVAAPPDRAESSDDRPHARPRRNRPLLVVRRGPALPRLSRRRVGAREARRRCAVRAALARGLPGRALVAHDPAQARELSAGVRGFSIERVADFDERDVERLLGDAGIIRHRGKIEATIGNAVAALELPTGCRSSSGRSLLPAARPGRRGRGELPATTPESAALSKELKRRGFRFVGPTTVYALMQSAGLRRRPPRRLFLRGEARVVAAPRSVHIRHEGVTLPSHLCRYVVSYEDNDHHPMGEGGSG